MTPRHPSRRGGAVWGVGLVLLTASPALALTAAVLPTSRSVQVGATATVFATVVNTGFSAATGCRIALASAIAANFSYQTTDPGTNTLTGTPNAPVGIGRGAAQTFAISITPTAPIAPTDVQFAFACDAGPAAPVTTGVNTLLLSASSTPVPDVIATVLPPNSFTPGVVSLDTASHEGAFGVTALNVGAADTITVSADTGAAALPVTVTLCQTSIATAGCASPPAATVAIPVASGAGVGLAVFVQASGFIPPDPAASRIFVRFKDAGGTTRGATSIAIEAQGFPGGPSLRAFLDGSQEVPPTSSAAAGSVFFSFNPTTRELSFSVILANLEGSQTAAEIHGPAPAGANAPTLFSLPLGNSSGTLTLTAVQAADLLAGLWYVNVLTTAFPGGEIRGQILQVRLTAAVLPSSRSVQIGTAATAFASVRNLGPEDATGCRIALATSIPAAFTYQTTNPATNTVTGSPNTPVDIPADASQSFVVAITASAPIAPTDVAFRFDCANGPPATAITGVNTLLLSASAVPVADVIAIALVPAATVVPGVLLVNPQAAFALAAVNVGALANVTLTADTGSVALPLTVALCQTSPTGACLSPPAPSVTLALGNGGGAGFAVFVAASGPVKANAAVNRIFLRFKEASGITRGATSVAIFAP